MGRLAPNYEKANKLQQTIWIWHFCKCSEKSEKITALSAPTQLCNALKNGGDVSCVTFGWRICDLRMTKRYAELDESYIEQRIAFIPSAFASRERMQIWTVGSCSSCYNEEISGTLEQQNGNGI